MPAFTTVVVADEQQAVAHVLGVVVVAEAEAVVRVEPRDAGVEPAVASTDVDHLISPKFVANAINAFSRSLFRQLGEHSLERRDVTGVELAGEVLFDAPEVHGCGSAQRSPAFRS